MTGCPTCGGFGDRHDLAAHFDGGEDVRVTYAEAVDCTCDGRQEFVCHDIRNEPHLVGCPRWGFPKEATP